MGHLAAFSAGALASFGFAPYAWRLALAAGLIILFCTLHRARPVDAALRGGLFGLGYFGFGIWWIAPALGTYAHAPPWLAGGLTATLALYLSLYPAAAAGIAAKLCPPGAMRLLCAAALLGLLEWVRGHALTGFPWVLIGQGSLDTFYQGYLPVLGVYGAGLLMLLSAAGLAAALRIGFREAGAALALPAGIALGGMALGAAAWTTPAGAPQPVALVQGGIPMSERWQPQFLDRIKRRYWNLAGTVADAPLVVWPESAIPQLYHEHHAYYWNLVDKVLAPDATLLTGAFFAAGRGRLYHTGAINLRTGARYRKRKLVPFGEFSPLADWLAPVYQNMQINMNDLSPSDDRPVLKVRGRNVGISICYEAIFPEFIRDTAPSVGYLINLSNDSWLGDTRGSWQIMEASRLRAAETGRELARATGGGVTAVLAADGSVRRMAPQFEPAVLEAEIQPRRGATPYARAGEWPLLALALICLGLAAIRRRTGDGDSRSSGNS